MLELSSSAFVANTVLANVNPIALDQLGYTLPMFVSTLGLPLVLAALYAFEARACAGPHARLVILYWVVSAVPLLGLLKFGAIYNYWIEFAAGTAVLATWFVWQAARANRSRVWGVISTVLVWLLVLNLAWLATKSIFEGPWSRGGIAEPAYAAPDTDFTRLVERVRNESGEVLADPMDVEVLADRPVLLEPVIFGILNRQHLWDPAPLVRSICRGDVHLLVLQLPLEYMANYAPFGVPWWPEPVCANSSSTCNSRVRPPVATCTYRDPRRASDVLGQVLVV
jgi:hypothetical protein